MRVQRASRCVIRVWTSRYCLGGSHSVAAGTEGATASTPVRVQTDGTGKSTTVRKIAAFNVSKISVAGTKSAQGAINLGVNATLGAAISAPTGETVLIGAGILAGDVPVNVQRLDINQITAITGLALPDPAVLQAVGAFRLDIGEAATSYPMQMVVTLQGAQGDYEAGQEVLFFRKGQIYKPDGLLHDTWWLVDNGFIGQSADGSLVARTASRPYEGMDSGGEYLVARRLPGVIGSGSDLSLGAGSWLDFGGFALGGGLSGALMSSDILGILAGSAGTLSAGRYNFGQPQFADIPFAQRQSNEIDTTALLPPVETPYGRVASPNLAGAYFDEPSQTLTFYRSGASPTNVESELVVRAIFSDGSTKDLMKLPGSSNLPIKITAQDLATAGLGNVALGSLRFQAVRLVDTSTWSSSGRRAENPPIEIAGNTIALTPTPDMAAVLTRTSVQFVRQNKVVGEVALLDKIGSSTLGGQYIYGEKTQPIAFSTDLSRAYIAGRGLSSPGVVGPGVIYVIDLISFKLIETINPPRRKKHHQHRQRGRLHPLQRRRPLGHRRRLSPHGLQHEPRCQKLPQRADQPQG